MCGCKLGEVNYSKKQQIGGGTSYMWLKIRKY